MRPDANLMVLDVLGEGDRSLGKSVQGMRVYVARYPGFDEAFWLA